MNVSASTVESNNMIVKPIRRFNASIVRAIMSIRLRAIGAALLSSFAGLSLTTTIIPTAMESMGVMDTFSARWDLGGFAVYSMMAWAVGGWAVQRSGDKRLGAIILGFVGLVTGLLFTGVGIGTEMSLLLTGGGAALLYGAVGGMIIGDALRSPDVDDSDPAAPRGRIGDLGIFSYFKNNK
ncbi:MAG: hypothetical protein FIB02_04965 [Desulfuromonas sp.]|nr:hypothetical protein [Desulfuromonas sp.]